MADLHASRRRFLAAGLGSGGALVFTPGMMAGSQDSGSAVTPPPAGDAPVQTPPPEAEGITERTIAEAEKLAGVRYTAEERRQMLPQMRGEVARYLRRRRVELTNDRSPAQIFDPRLPGQSFSYLNAARFRSVTPPETPCPDQADDIAFAPVSHQAAWIRRGELTSVRLTEIYLDRLERYGPALECVVTLTRDLAMGQARRADRELAEGRDRGPLHGIPWGAKDLLDTRGIRTSWGATPYKDRVPQRDAITVQRLEEAGAVLVAKLTLGALAYGDIWFDGRTNNPFNIEQGSSGSSAGSAAAAAAGLVSFAIGSETLGSIVSPTMRCGSTGLRPTFGRVARTGAMALSWTMDKLGPICRSVDDCMLVLRAISGHDHGDPSSYDMPIDYDATASLRGMRVGYVPAWFEGGQVSAHDRRAFEVCRDLGVELVEIDLPDWPYDALLNILYVEAAAAFEEMTLSNADDQLVWQEPQAWPNTFRRTRFVPAIEFVQADRLRRSVMEMLAERFERVEAMIGPSFAGSMLLITNTTGHPSVTFRTGFRQNGTPTGITLWGRLFDEGRICRLGHAMEQVLGVWNQRPQLDVE